MLLDNLLLFGRVLRSSGLEVHHARLLDAVRATEWIGVRSRHDVRATLRALLVHRHDDFARFDAAFDLFFRVPGSHGLPMSEFDENGRANQTATEGALPWLALEDAPSEEAGDADAGVGGASAMEVLRTKDFADFTEDELRRAQGLLAQLPWHLGIRRTRRWEAASGGAIDLRPVLRRNLMRGGEPIELPRRARRVAPRPIVLLGDVSGSMERYSRILLQFVFGLAQSETRVEAFVFSTRLTRLTRRVPVASIAGELTIHASRTRRIVHDIQDWGGGTRIGEALGTFNMRWARRVMRNGPVVLIVSDGWDRGDPELLARELARLRRNCRRLIWLNPLLGHANYEPLTRGMQTALGHIDDFLPAHNLASLDQLARHLTALPAGHRRAGLKAGPSRNGHYRDVRV